MADPFSVASAAAGIISLGITVTDGLIQYYTSWKSCGDDIVLTLGYINSVNENLKLLLDLVNDPETDSVMRRRMIDCIEPCQSLVSKLERKLNKIRGSDDGSKDQGVSGKPLVSVTPNQQMLLTVRHKINVQWQRSLYPFKESTIVKLRETILELQSSVMLALQIHSVKNVQKVHSEVLGLADQRQNEERQAILEWLSTADFAAQQADNKQRRHPSTGVWLLQSKAFQGWMSREFSTIFCPGIPGSGKTIITCAVVDELQNKFTIDDSVAVCYLYCNYKWRQQQTMEFFLSSVLEQLIWRLKEIPSSLKSLYKRHREQRTRPSVAELSQELIVLVNHFKTTFIVVDALDECNLAGGVALQLLSRIFQLQESTRVQLFATSRHVPDISQRFAGKPQLEIRASDHDVSLYVATAAQSFPMCARHLIPEIQEAIISAIDGMFLLAKLHVDTFMQLRKPRQVREFLASLQKKRGLPRSEALEEAYNVALGRIEEQSQETITFAKQIFRWITYAQRPLTIQELQIALAAEDDPEFVEEDFVAPEDMLAVCAGLINIDEQMHVVTFVHYTAQEYFERIRDNWLPDSISKISSTLVSYLLRCAALDEPHQDDESYCRWLLEHPLLDYSGRYWGLYASSSLSNEWLDNALTICTTDNYLKGAVQLLKSSEYRFEGFSQLVPKSVSGLHLAGHFGLAPLAARLLDTTKNADMTDSNGRTPLSWAAEQGHFPVVKLLTQRHEVNVNSRDDCQDQTPVSLAAERGLGLVIQLLSDGGLDDSQIEKFRGAFSPLAWAAERSPEAVLKLLEEKDALELDEEDDTELYDGLTALMYAASKGHEDIVKHLLERDGIQPNLKDQYGRTALAHASENGHFGCVKLLAAHSSVDVEAKSRWYAQTPLSLAAESGHVTSTEFLSHLEDVDLHTQDKWYGQTPLSLAAEAGHLEAVKVLVKQPGIKVDLASHSGRTPFAYAAKSGHEAVVRFLMARSDVNVNARDKNGNTPLDLAVQKGHVHVVKVLSENRHIEGLETLKLPLDAPPPYEEYERIKMKS